MRQQDALHAQRLAPDDIEQHVDFVARIDDDRLACRLARNDVAVLLERRNRACLDDHCMRIPRRDRRRQHQHTDDESRWRCCAAPLAAAHRLGRLGGLGRFRADVEDGRNAPELGGDRRRTLRAVLDVRREHPADDLFELRRHVGVQARQHEPTRTLPAGEHLEHHGAQRIDVAARIAGSSGELLGSDVRNCGRDGVPHHRR